MQTGALGAFCAFLKVFLCLYVWFDVLCFLPYAMLPAGVINE